MIQARSRVHRGLPVARMLLLLAGARPSQAADTFPWTRDDAAHLLRRAGFGGTPAQIDTLHALGRDAAVEYLLSGQLPGGAEPVFATVSFPAFKTKPVEAKGKANQK